MPWLGAIQSTSISQAKTHLRALFYRTASSGCFQISVIFLEGEKQKNFFIAPEAVVLRCSVKKSILKSFTKFTGKHLCQSLYLMKLATWGSGTSVFCEFCENFNNTFFKVDLRWLLLFLRCAWYTWNLVIASKLKSFPLIILKNTTPIYLSIFSIKNRKNHFVFAFYFMFPFFFKFLQTSLITFSEFSYFMKGFKKDIMNISR